MPVEGRHFVVQFLLNGAVRDVFHRAWSGTGSGHYSVHPQHEWCPTDADAEVFPGPGKRSASLGLLPPTRPLRPPNARGAFELRPRSLLESGSPEKGVVYLIHMLQGPGVQGRYDHSFSRPGVIQPTPLHRESLMSCFFLPHPSIDKPQVRFQAPTRPPSGFPRFFGAASSLQRVPAVPLQSSSRRLGWPPSARGGRRGAGRRRGPV